jgi:DeoR/GlpR family transcriptional regulator of sugar metabolism
MIEQSECVALLVDHTKLGERAMCSLSSLAKVDYLFTGATPESRKFARTQSGAKLQIHLADFAAR